MSKYKLFDYFIGKIAGYIIILLVFGILYLLYFLATNNF